MYQKKDYQKKSFRNPFFINQKDGLTKKIFWLIIVLAIFFTIYYLFVGLNLIFNEILISGNDKITSQEISAVVKQQENHRRLFIFSQKNIIFFSKSELINSLLKNYPLDR